jgi:hypothetical protein
VKYLRMVFCDEKKLDALSDAEWRAAQARQSLHLVTSVHVRNRRVSVTDGPFAETNEQIG